MLKMSLLGLHFSRVLEGLQNWIFMRGEGGSQTNVKNATPPLPPMSLAGLGYEGCGLGCEGSGLGYDDCRLGCEGSGLGYEGSGLGYEGCGLGYEGCGSGFEDRAWEAIGVRRLGTGRAGPGRAVHAKT